jgi:hypothetical protein
MQLDELAHKRQTDIRADSRLTARYAGALMRDGKNRLLIDSLEPEIDTTQHLRVLADVVEQIRDHLPQFHAIDVSVYGYIRDLHT